MKTQQTKAKIRGTAAGIALVMASMLGSGVAAHGADMTAHSQLMVQVRPEAALETLGGDAVRLKIRLAPGAQARVWTADSCGVPAPNTYTVAQSGIHVIPISTLANGSSSNVCLASSDGSLRTQLTISSPSNR